jgi:hypothetical protein
MNMEETETNIKLNEAILGDTIPKTTRMRGKMTKKTMILIVHQRDTILSRRRSVQSRANIVPDHDNRPTLAFST